MAAREIVEYLFKGDPTDLLQATKKVEGGIKGTGDAADKAAAEVNQSFSRMASNMRKVGDKMQTAGKALTAGVTVPLALALKSMVQGAIEDQKSMTNLESALKRTTKATDDEVESVFKYLEATEQRYAFDEEKLRPAMERLARATGDTDQAQRDLSLAMDVSRATGKDLDTVVQAMGRAYDGSVGALGRLGIATKDVGGKTLDLETIFQNMNRQFGGASKDYMDTAAGKAEAAQFKFMALKDSIGAALVPVMEDLADVVSGIIDLFMKLPDWAQKGTVGLLLLKGPAIWLAGTGVKLIGQYIAKVKTINAATEAAAAAAARHGAEGGTLFASGMNRGTREAKTAMSGFTTFLKGLGVAGIVAGIAVSIERSFDGWSKFKRAVDSADGPVLERAQSSLDNWNSTQTRTFETLGKFTVFGDAFKQFGDAQRRGLDPENARLFLELTDKAVEKGGVYAQKAQEIGEKNISAKDGVAQLNAVLEMTPGQLDPAVAEAEQLAFQMGMSADQIERLNQALSDLSAFINFEQSVLRTKDALTDLQQAVIDAKTEDSLGGLKITGSEIDDIYKSALNAAGALESELKTGLETGAINAQQAADRIAALDRNLAYVQEQAPETAGQIGGLRDRINELRDRNVQIWVETGNAKRAIDNFTSYMTRTLSSGNLNFWSLTRGVNMLAGNEQGGVIPFARGGVYMANSGGGITRGPMAVIGEGREPREYVIPTDTRYRDRALSLMNSAAAELGVGAPRMSSSFTANINVTGGSDPEATAAAVADAVEQAFARKKRREGSLAFS